MTDEAAESRGPAQGAPAPSAPPTDPSAAPVSSSSSSASSAADGPPEPPPYVPPAPGAAASDDPPPPPPPPPGNPPPWFGTADGPSFSRDKLVRPVQGRYIAGVSGALGRATNTDPVLWRVLLAVLSFFGGVGVLIYLLGWLLIPAENDTASPIESLLGRGRSGMKPLSIVLLGGAAVLTFAFVVNDGFRAALLAVAVLVGAALLLKRNSNASPAPAAAPADPGAPADPWAHTAPFPPAAAPADQTAAFATTAPAPPGPAPASAPAEEPVTAATPLPPLPPQPPQFTPPPGGYRPPFAPHGPFAGSGHHGTPLQAPAKEQKPPKPPRERSKLGRITFFAVLLVMGLLALLNAVGVAVSVSAYFAAALAVIALGLIVGTWFGRARGLIALALVATAGLGIASGLERFPGQVGTNVYRPTTAAAVADRYDFSLGNATLDLRRVNFTGVQQETTVQMKFGQVKVLLPENVDTIADLRMGDGRAVVFGRELNGTEIGAQEYSDLGADGAGGGSLKLIVEMNTGNVEVIR
jgi:phage shock protein PspC (stress-responsive transcriptional regulator)